MAMPCSKFEGSLRALASGMLVLGRTKSWMSRWEDLGRRCGNYGRCGQETSSNPHTPGTPNHILGHAGLPDFDTELEQLSLDPWSSPERIGDAHLANQLSHFERHREPATTASRPPAPIQPKARAMPTNNSVRLHDRQRIANRWKQPIETNEYQVVEDAERKSLRSSPPQSVNLLRNVQISASSAARDRNRSTTVQPMSLKRSLIEQRRRPILGQPPAR
jgi:hypothetical protein